MFRKTLLLAASGALLFLGLASPALAGGVAGKSFLVQIIWPGLPFARQCFHFQGKSSAEQGDISVGSSGEVVGRWRRLGNANGQTLFKMRMDSVHRSFRLRGLRENDGPGESIGIAGYATDGENFSNLSMAGYRVPSCKDLRLRDPGDVILRRYAP